MTRHEEYPFYPHTDQNTRPPQRIVVWDIETKQDGKELVPFLVGVRWGETPQEATIFEGSDCMAQFVTWAFENNTKDTIFFAHNGGGFDHAFLINELVSKNPGIFMVKPVMVGSSAIIVMTRKRGGSDKGPMFVDSIRTLNMSLKTIGQKLGGAQKLDFDVTTTPTDDPRWKEYLNLDTLVLYQAMLKTQRALLDLGGTMKTTAGSSSIELLRKKYLKKEIYPNVAHTEFYRSCYVGGRVELFDLRRRTNVKLYDINSLYPYACTKPLPVQLEAITEGWDEAITEPDMMGFVECLVSVPDHVTIGPLPVRRGDQLIFPIGTFRGSWSSADLKNLFLCGGKVLQTVRTHRFKTYPFARKMMEDLYAARLDIERPEMGLAAKLLMNSLYGKFAQKDEKNDLLFNPTLDDMDPSKEWTCHNPGEPIERWESCYSERQMHCLPFIAAHVTAIARSIHYPYLFASQDPVYCDTDCLAQSDAMDTSTDLGKMKLEVEYEWFEAILPKLYHGKATTGKMVDKAKGFGGWAKEKYEHGIVEHLKLGGSVTVKAPAKLRTIMKSGSLQPFEQVTQKRIHATYQKRIVNPDGTTKPIKLWES